MIIKQSVVDVLMFLFERYLVEDEPNETVRVADVRDSIQLRLEEMGFDNSEINQAFDWLESLTDSQHDNQLIPLKSNQDVIVILLIFSASVL